MTSTLAVFALPCCMVVAAIPETIPSDYSLALCFPLIHGFQTTGEVRHYLPGCSRFFGGDIGTVQPLEQSCQVKLKPLFLFQRRWPTGGQAFCRICPRLKALTTRSRSASFLANAAVVLSIWLAIVTASD